MNLRYPKCAGRMLARFGLAAACAAFSLSSARAEDAAPGAPGAAVGSVNLPAGHSAAEVKAALVTAFLGRDWTVKSSDEAAVVGYIKHRGVEAYLTARYSAGVVSFYSQAWKIGRDGNHEKPDMPTGWIANIKKDLVKDLEKGAAHS